MRHEHAQCRAVSDIMTKCLYARRTVHLEVCPNVSFPFSSYTWKKSLPGLNYSENDDSPPCSTHGRGERCVQKFVQKT